MSAVARQSFPPNRRPSYDERQNLAKLAPGIFNEKHDLWDAKLSIGAKGTPAEGLVSGQNEKFAFYVDTSRNPLPPRLVVAPLKQTNGEPVAQWSMAKSRPMSAADIGALTTVIALSAEAFGKEFESISAQFKLELGTGNLVGGKVTLGGLSELETAYARSLAVLDTINDPAVWKNRFPDFNGMAGSLALIGASLALTIQTTPLGFAMFAGASLSGGLFTSNAFLHNHPAARLASLGSSKS